MNSLNKIFFGPAGTGKTREAKKYAVEEIFKNEHKFEELSISTLDIKEDSPRDSTFSELMKNINDVNYHIEEIFKVTKYQGYLAKLTKDDLLRYRAYPLIESITFHQNYSYQDFIEGIFPETNSKGDIEYRVKDGAFKKLCNRAIKNPTYNYVLIIDEINRGNISAIFGELFTLIEDDKRIGSINEMSINLPYSKDTKGNPEKLKVPKNLYIIATMNTVDKSIAMIDIALRRRFEFIECMPNYDVLKDIKVDDTDIKLDKLLESINNRITILKNENYQIGHSYLLPKDFDTNQNKNLTFDELKNIFIYKIIPLLQEYFYADWMSICAVLNQSFKNLNGNGILKSEVVKNNIFLDEFRELIEFKNQKVISINREFSEKDIKDIYNKIQ